MGLPHLGAPPKYRRVARIWAFFGESSQGLPLEISFFVPFYQMVIEIALVGRCGGTQLANIGCMIELVLNISSRASSLPATVQALASVMLQAKLERACVDCRLYAEIGNPQSLLYVEQWATLQELESQLRSQRFGMLLAIMETSPEPPELEVRMISEQRDLEYVSTVRLNPDGVVPVNEERQLGS